MEDSLQPHGASFRHCRIGAGEEFCAGSTAGNHFIFLLSGALELRCNEVSGKRLEGGQFVLIPVATDAAYAVHAASEALVMTFSWLLIKDAGYRRKLAARSGAYKEGFAILPIREPLGVYLQNLLALMQGGINPSLLHPLKAEEFFMLLPFVYTPDEAAALLYQNLEIWNLKS